MFRSGYRPIPTTWHPRGPACVETGPCATHGVAAGGVGVCGCGVCVVVDDFLLLLRLNRPRAGSPPLAAAVASPAVRPAASPPLCPSGRQVTTQKVIEGLQLTTAVRSYCWTMSMRSSLLDPKRNLENEGKARSTATGTEPRVYRTEPEPESRPVSVPSGLRCRYRHRCRYRCRYCAATVL